MNEPVGSGRQQLGARDRAFGAARARDVLQPHVRPLQGDGALFHPIRAGVRRDGQIRKAQRRREPVHRRTLWGDGYSHLHVLLSRQTSPEPCGRSLSNTH